jgi:MFS family permease
MMINIDSFSIILFMIPISLITGRFHPMVALIGGMVISLVGFMMSGGTNVGWMVAMAIFIFSIGEMGCSPKFSEYIGLTAPPEKKALYMGYSNIPFAIGWGVGNLVSGPLYDALGSKENFARQWMETQGGMSESAVAAIPQEKVMETLAAMMNNGAGGTLEEATRMLWHMYDPWRVWVILTAIGTAATIGMVIFYFKNKNTGISSRPRAENV